MSGLDLPVQTPTKYSIINTKTAKSLGLDVPATQVVRADEVMRQASWCDLRAVIISLDRRRAWP
jgi:hypothetical protein